MTLREIYETHEGRLINKWDHYIDIYDQYFNKYRGKDIVFLEIGVAHGGSLQMWRKYFGEDALIIGVDINPECKKLEEGNTKIYIGSQSDENFLSKIKAEIPKVNILLDDGGHTMNQQITTFNNLFEHIVEDGIYVFEDLHTSYWSEYGGGGNDSFIEFSKKFVDNLHGWHERTNTFNHITESVFGVHYYDSMIVLEKRKIIKSQSTIRGTDSLKWYTFQ